jgi:hypothetical protein
LGGNFLMNSKTLREKKNPDPYMSGISRIRGIIRDSRLYGKKNFRLSIKGDLDSAKKREKNFFLPDT